MLYATANDVLLSLLTERLTPAAQSRPMNFFPVVGISPSHFRNEATRRLSYAVASAKAGRHRSCMLKEGRFEIAHGGSKPPLLVTNQTSKR
jgi:hypothetical protein